MTENTISNHGFVLDSWREYSRPYAPKWQFKRELCRCSKPYVAASDKNERKKRRKIQLNAGQQAFVDYYEKHDAWLMESYSALLPEFQQLAVFGDSVPNGDPTARIVDSLGDVDWQDGCEKQPRCDEMRQPLRVENDSSMDASALCNRLVETPVDCATIVNLLGANCSLILSPNARFLLSDINDLAPIANEKFDLIVMDPPWENRAVARRGHYETLDESIFSRLPISTWLNDDGIVAVWVTNKIKLIDYVKNVLFPSWRVDLVGEWSWLKVTENGEPVIPFGQHHRSPFEPLLVGRRRQQYREQNQAVMNRLVMASPTRLHSQKPFIGDALSEAFDLPKDKRCLELFARRLQPGWTSWGNQVLKHQLDSYFEPVSK